ncbi:MAG TPA: hypothetical protein VN222_10055, partial [Novosphingobium sp.]|nr:hypothetical protein [Novosphingobium sp.]
MRKAHRGLLCGRIVSALALAWASNTAYAQQAAAPPQNAPAPADEAEDPAKPIVVTGSRIATGFDAPTPVSVLSA